MGGGDGVPLAATVGPANAHDVRGLRPTVTACPLPGYGTPGRTPRCRYGDRAYRSRGHEGVRRWRGLRPRFARPGVAHGSGLGVHRWVVERIVTQVHQNRRRKVRYEKRADIQQGFLTLACIRLCWLRLKR